MSCDAGSPDQVFRDLTILFGLYSMYDDPFDERSGDLSDMIVRRGRQTGAICARSGNYFPGERLTRDGQGRIVGRPFYTEGPAMPPSIPWPTFVTNDGN
jgi:hypothetical protein